MSDGDYKFIDDAAIAIMAAITGKMFSDYTSDTEFIRAARLAWGAAYSLHLARRQFFDGLTDK